MHVIETEPMTVEEANVADAPCTGDAAEAEPAAAEAEPHRAEAAEPSERAGRRLYVGALAALFG